jgi:2',3'-cyclic-nucleotide 2'-phosphodiesterase (5'-nucleotidase family)
LGFQTSPLNLTDKHLCKKSSHIRKLTLLVKFISRETQLIPCFTGPKIANRLNSWDGVRQLNFAFGGGSMKTAFFLIFALMSSILFPIPSDAQLIQIIHTNDLHSYFRGYDDGRAGYAQLKTKIDQLKASALLRNDLQEGGIESIVLDGGDFGEGNSFYLSGDGIYSLMALSVLGVDAAVIGNHDHMLGTGVLADQIKRSRARTRKHPHYLSANLIYTEENGLTGLVQPYVDLQIKDIKIRVIGLSTPEPIFQPPLKPSFILPPTPIALLQESIAKRSGVDVILGLTHLGVSADRNLVSKTEEIDLIIGGHSHTRLERVLFEKNKVGREIPIVQTGAHGLAVGSLILRVPPSRAHGSVEVVSYQLHDINNSIRPHQGMLSLVEEAERKRDELFDGRWDEVIGESRIKLSGYENGSNPTNETCWGQHMARMARKVTGAQIGIHMAHFDGIMTPPGEITYGNLVDNFPHVREYGDAGWRYASFEDRGRRLRVVLNAMISLRHELGFNFDGLTWDSFNVSRFIPWLGGNELNWGLKIGDEKLKKNQSYKVALPAEVGHVAAELLGTGSTRILPNFMEYDIYAWDVMEEYVRKHSPIVCLPKEGRRGD